MSLSQTFLNIPTDNGLEPLSRQVFETCPAVQAEHSVLNCVQDECSLQCFKFSLVTWTQVVMFKTHMV